MGPTKFCELLGIKYPIIQAGMVWVSGAKLAAASANSGILGIIGAGSMSPDLLRLQIKKAMSLSDQVQGKIGVNLPLLYSRAQEQIDVAIEEGIRLFITSAGTPHKWTAYLKDRGSIVGHVCSTPELALKCEKAGVDFVVAEGFEAGGHNGRDELTTMALVPQVVDAVKIPVIAAGGIASGRQIAAALCLGASGVQMGTRFINVKESSAHEHFKQAIIDSKPCDTMLVLKSLVPVRLLKNDFFYQVAQLESVCASEEELKALLGKSRSKMGMFEGDLINGELEVGQVASMIQDIPTTQELVQSLIKEFQLTINSF